MSFVNKVYNGGFMAPRDVSKAIISTSVPSDNMHSYVIKDDNSTYKSPLFPVFQGSDKSSFIPDAMSIEIFWDQTTYTLPASPGFIESPPDDYHPMSETEFAEARSALDSPDRYVRSPHYIVKPDSTSSYYGKDRFDNFMTEPLSNFGKKFNWFDSTSKTTFNGGDLYASPTGLHLSFMYLTAPDATSYTADLYYSKFSDNDGTFGTPIALDAGINVGGFGTNNSPAQFKNRLTDPRFLFVNNVGLFLNTLRSGYNIFLDSTEFMIDMKLSRDDGTTWSNYNHFPLNFWTDQKDSIGLSLPIEEVNNSPNMHWAYGDNKIVCLLDFRDVSSSGGNSSNLYNHINILVSQDLGKSFSQITVDYNRIIGNFNSVAFTNSNFKYFPAALHYDPKIGRFVITVGIYASDGTNPVAYGIVFLTNLDQNLQTWGISLFDNLSNTKLFPQKTAKNWNFGWKSYAYSTQDRKFTTCVGNNGLCYLIMNGGLSYKFGKTYPNAFDSYADYSGTNLASGSISYAWQTNPFMIKLDLIQATDSLLYQYNWAQTPWSSRKIQAGSIDHKNNPSNGTAGIVPGNGATLSIFYDSVINNNNELKLSGNSDDNLDNPHNRFFIKSLAIYKNNFWFLGTDHVLDAGQENRFIEYQIPTIGYRPDWSNVNIKPRQIYYLTPSRYHDSTFIGWSNLGVASGQDIQTEYLPTQKKYWEVKFLRKDSISASGQNCGLRHVGDDFAFLGNRGVSWDADSTRGIFAHFICSLDSGFYKDITSMVHALCVNNTPGGTANRSSMQTWLGKDHIGIASSGSASVNNYQTFKMDVTRSLEFLGVVNRFRSFDLTHEHRMFTRYKGDRDWTFLYYSLVTSGNSGIVPDPGTFLGNLTRWPAVISGDNTNVVYYQFHAEGWSAWEMHRQYPPNVSGTLTPSSDNKLTVLPQPCTPNTNYLPRGIQIAWAGQDSTVGARFKVTNSVAKNSIDKVLDNRPNIGWQSLDGTSPITINIDFGESIQFNSVALYNHNLQTAKFSYGQENATTDMTGFLIHSIRAVDSFGLSDNVDSTNFRDMIFFSGNINSDLNIVDKDSLLIYQQDFMKWLAFNDPVNKTFMFVDDVDGNLIYIAKKCVSCNVLNNDSSALLQFIHPPTDGWILPGMNPNFDFDDNYFSFGNGFWINPTKHLYILNQKITARYIKIENFLIDGLMINGYFDGENMPNSDLIHKIGMLSFGLFEGNENPIENKIKTTFLSPTTLEKKYAGAAVPVTVGQQTRVKFDSKISIAFKGRQKQIEQMKYFLKSIGQNRDVFFFAPREISTFNYDPTGSGANLNVDISAFGFKYRTSDFYLVKMDNVPAYQETGTVSSLSFTLEEVT